MKKLLKIRKKSGFTLIELSFAVLFVALLALTVVVITMDLIGNYKRGLMLKQVNTVGNSLIDDFRASIGASSSKKLDNICELSFTGSAASGCTTDGAYSAVYLLRKGNVTIGEDTDQEKSLSNVPLFGAFCTGSYSYIWNSGYWFDETYTVATGINRASLKYRTESGNKELKDFRLIKIRDPKRAVCLTPVSANSQYHSNASLVNSLASTFDITAADPVAEEPVDLLENDEYSDLALYDLTVVKPATDKSERDIFYSGSFILATVKGGINITATGDYCATPSEYDIEDFDYCAINKFNFAIQASGE